MMNRVELDDALITRIKRAAHTETLTVDDRVALNLLWRKGVQVPVLAKIFGCSRNTIYYKALTGTADSYPTSAKTNLAAETNHLVDRFVKDAGGLDEAVRRYVPSNLIAAVNEANAELAKAKENQ